jgi:outer membrane protein assembly factor BamA
MQVNHADRKVGILVLCTILLVFSFSVHPVLAQSSNPDSLQDELIIHSIHITGNALTKPYIIYRELLFKTGDTLSAGNAESLFDRSEKNLLNTSLFNFATISSTRDKLGLNVSITVIERWYIWPTPMFELTDRNFNAWWASRDFTRVNYGFRVKWSNFRGRMENLDIFLRFGKNPQYSLLYELPYIEKTKRFGAGLEIGYVRKREVGFVTRKDKLEFIFNQDYLLHQQYAALKLSYRGNIITTHLVEIRYQHIVFSDSLLKYNPDYAYPHQSVSDFLSFYYKLKIDNRDTKYYPLSGWYVDAEFCKGGLGTRFEQPIDIMWVRSTSRLFLPISSRWYFGTSIVGKLSSGSYQPYFLMQGLGYDRDFVRGYEYYVVDGNHYALSRNTIKFAVLPQRIKNLEFIHSRKFSQVHFASYLTLFADAGYVWESTSSVDYLNELPGTLLLGTGLGIDVVTYYDKVMRIEYSLNKLGESGIFIHFIAGI